MYRRTVFKKRASTEANGETSLRSLHVASAVANFDRMTFGPMLVTMALSFDRSVGETAAIGTAYFVAYGATQPLWAPVSDRFGRIKLIVWCMTIAAIASAASAIAPTFETLMVARAITGAAFGAIVTMVITHIGDSLEVQKRQSVLSDLLAWLAAGMTIATLIGGAMSQYAHWRWMHVLSAIGAGSLALVVHAKFRDHEHAIIDVKPWHQVTAVAKSPWTLVVLALSLLEGVALLGALAVLPAIAENEGTSATVGGLIAATFGVSVLALTRLVKRLSHKPMVPMIIGAICVAAAHILPFTVEGVWPLVVDAVLLGGAWAAMHSSLQTWMTSTVAKARAMAIGFMTAALFVGSGLGAVWFAGMLDSGGAASVFKTALGLSLVLAAAAISGRFRYEGKTKY
jgi:predicted MFS family arabinose efflux permease